MKVENCRTPFKSYQVINSKMTVLKNGLDMYWLGPKNYLLGEIFHFKCITRGTFRQVPTRRIRLSFVESHEKGRFYDTVAWIF